MAGVFIDWIFGINDRKTKSDEGHDRIKVTNDLFLKKGEDRKEDSIKSTSYLGAIDSNYFKVVWMYLPVGGIVNFLP